MRKKYLSALLFGALLVASTGTFTSCKDYDDDINNLQEQIDAQKSLSEKLAAAETAITELQKADTELQAKIDAATDAAEKAALEAQQNAIAEAAKQLEAVKTELTALINGQTEATNEAIEDINAKIAEIQGSVVTLEKYNGDIEALRNADSALQQSISDLDAKIAENAKLIGELQTALKTQEEALNNFKEATGTDISGINSDIDALQAKIAELAGSEDLRLISEQLADLQEDFNTLSSKVNEISNSLNVLNYAFYTGVTHVSLVIKNGTELDVPQQITLRSAKSITDYVFGEGMENQQTFKKGFRTKQEDKIMVRVSPVTAVLDKENIKFINSKGDDAIMDFVSVKAVNPYNDILTTRGTSASGLWEVVLEWKKNKDGDDVDKEFNAITKVEVDTEDPNGSDSNGASTEMKDVLFAMEVQDFPSLRGAVSEYNLTFGEAKTEAKDEIKFDVLVGTNKFTLDNLHNRALKSEETGVPTPAELNWKDGAQAEIYKEGIFKNVVEVNASSSVGEDNRQDVAVSGTRVNNPVVESKQGSFTVRMKDSGAAYYYITLDKERALSSDDSEISAWNIIESSIEGINKVYSVVSDPEVKIGFTKNNINDVLGFRIYAINANGTLQDPDGRAFYVRVGEIANTVSFSSDITPDANMTDVKSAELENVDFSVFKNNDKDIEFVNLQSDKSIYNGSTVQNSIPFDLTFVFEDDSEITTVGVDAWSTGELKTNIFNELKLKDLTKVKNVYATPRVTSGSAVDWTKYIDGETYKTTLTFGDANKVVIGTVELNVTKVVPTSIPADFDWKDKQLSDGNVFNCYLWPWHLNIVDRDWKPESATNAYMHLDQIFNYDNTKSNGNKYTFTFRTDDPKQDMQIEGLKASSASQFNLLKSADQFDMIDGKTKFGVTIQYNYGYVSSQNPNTEVICSKNDWSLVYHNMFAKTHYELKWNSKDEIKDVLASLKVGVAPQLDDKDINFADYIDVDNKYDNYYDYIYIKDKSNKSLTDLLTEDKYLGVEEIKFVNKNSNVESEYFKAEKTTFGSGADAKTGIKLVPIKDQSQPTGVVESQIYIKFVDVFGFEREERFDINVNPNRD